MNLWAPIKPNKIEIKDSSKYLISNYLTSKYLTKNWSDKIQDPFFAFCMGRGILMLSFNFKIVRGKVRDSKNF